MRGARGGAPSAAPALFLICAVLALTLALSAAASSPVDLAQDFFPVKSDCTGSIAECLGDDDDVEFMMDSEINRRILARRRRYISYGALRRNSVPCSRRGASYYNCRRGGRANPYSRGCSRITRCRR